MQIKHNKCDMKYELVGNTKICKIGLGSWTIGDDPKNEQREIDAFNYGYTKHQITLIDTAEMYGEGKSEKVVGKFLKGKNRSEFFVVDKILPKHAKENRYVERCKNSLKIMGLDYFDLYLLHWKGGVDLQKMVDEMENLVALGLIKRWGVSNFDVKDMEDLFKCKNGDHCFVNQCLYNISQRGVEFDLIPWCQKHSVLFMAYSPFGSNSENKKVMTSNPHLQKVVEEKHVSFESLMLAFVTRLDNVVALFKTSNSEHLESNMKDAFMDIDEGIMEEIEKAFPTPKTKKYLEKI